MAVATFHGQSALDQRELTPRSARFFGRSRLTSPRFWLTGIAFLAVYLACNKLTAWHQFDGLAITLWSPDNGLSLLLLTEGAMFVPFVFLGAVLTDVFIAGVRHSLYLTIAVELVATVGYVCLAAVLRYKLKFDPRRVRLADVVVLLTFVPVGTTLTALSYCGVLYLGGALPADRFCAAMRYFWIGDTVGIITIIPAATSVFAFLSKSRWRWSGDALVSCSVFILGTCLGFAVLFGAGDAKEYPMFYPLFLPIIWVAIRGGYAGVAVALLGIQLGLVATTTYLGYEAKDFSVFQMLMLVLSITGLLLGAVITERAQAAQATARAADGIGARVGLRRCGRDGHGARSRNQPAFVDGGELPACRAADVAVRCRQRAGDGCAEQGGDGGAANTRSAGTNPGFRLDWQIGPEAAGSDESRPEDWGALQRGGNRTRRSCRD